MAACVLAKRRGRSHGNADRSERGKAAARRPAQNERPAGGKGERCRLFVRAAPHPFKLRNVKAGGGTAVRIAARRARPWRAGSAAARQPGLRGFHSGCGESGWAKARQSEMRRVHLGCGALVRLAVRESEPRRVTDCGVFVCRSAPSRAAGRPFRPFRRRGAPFAAARHTLTVRAGRFARRPQAWMRGNGLFSSKALAGRRAATYPNSRYYKLNKEANFG